MLFFVFGTANARDQVVQSIYGIEQNQKFSFHLPTYFIFGANDLKLQYSFKYRVAKATPFYISFTELLFWDIYKKSKPFSDINYRPEAFYRLIDNSKKSLSTLD